MLQYLIRELVPKIYFRKGFVFLNLRLSRQSVSCVF